MHVVLALASLLAVQADGPEAWSALPLPRLCLEEGQGPAPEALWAGRHLRLRPAAPQPVRFGPQPHLPMAALSGLLAEESQRTRSNLRVEPGAPPLLVRGPASGVAAARDVCLELDRHGAALEIELAAWLTPGAARVGTHPARAVFESAVGDRPPLGRARLRSGGSAALGERSAREFVAGYDVQVATGSAVAAPRLGTVLEGRTLHVRASRARGGRAIVLEGLLDLCELEELADFDPDTRDLGLLQLPRVALVQAAFAGAVEPGGVLALQLAGTPLAEPDWTLWIEARGRPDEAGRWRLADLALLESSVLDLPWIEPEDEAPAPAQASVPRTLLQGTSAAGVAQLADQARGGAARVPIVWAGGLLLAPAGEAALWREIDQWVASGEAERLRAATLRVREGALEVVLPLLAGRPARVLVGRERARLTGYDLQVAQDTWMPQPRVESVLDGLLVQGRLEGSRLHAAAWRATGAPARVLGRAEAALARMPLETRSTQRASLWLEPGGAPRPALAQGAERAALEVFLESGPGDG